MTTDVWLKWVPLVVAVLQIVFLPLIMIALYSIIDSRIDRHNSDLYAHPALSDLKKLEEKIEGLASAVKGLEIAIAKWTGDGSAMAARYRES